MLAEFFVSLLTLDIKFFVVFIATHLTLLFGLLILAALLWEGKRSLGLIIFSGIAAMAVIDAVALFGLGFNLFHFLLAFLFVAVVFEVDKNAKSFLLALFSMALFTIFFQAFI